MIEVREATKTYWKGGEEIRAADALSLRADEGDLLVVHGPSGSGKSTLLLMIGGMLPPDAGAVVHDGEDIYRWSAGRRNRFRKHAVGFVFQRFFLVPYLTVYDNVRVPLALQGSRRDDREVIGLLAERLRIAHRLGHKPAELSVGEQQRAALARALAGEQKLILADEPTGNLDVENIEIIAECLAEESRRGRTLVVATHDRQLLDIATGSLRIERGRIAAPAGSG